MGLMLGVICGVPLGIFMGLNRFAKGFFDPLVELYRPVPPLAWAPLVITVFGIDNLSVMCSVRCAKYKHHVQGFR